MDTQYFELFRLDGEVWGVPIVRKPPNQYREEYDNCFNFPGKTACFFFVTCDDTIQREEALKFATTIAERRFVYCNVDLSSVNKAAELRSWNNPSPQK